MAWPAWVRCSHPRHRVPRRCPRVDDVGQLLRSFVSRVPFVRERQLAGARCRASARGAAVLCWPGPAGSGVGPGSRSGRLPLSSATIPVAVAVTCRALGLETRVRSVLPLLVLGPFAVWQAVSADAVFAAVAAWSVALAALSGSTRRSLTAVCWALAAGIALGSCAMLSYGLPLVGVVVLAALAASLGWSGGWVRLAGAVVVGVACVVGGFAFAGFAYWDAYPVLHQRYWDGLASARPSANSALGEPGPPRRVRWACRRSAPWRCRGADSWLRWVVRRRTHC